MAAECWKTRPCDEEMQSRCAHATAPERCPVKCVFGICHRPARTLIEDFSLYLGAFDGVGDVVKDECLYCEVYLRSSRKAKTG